MRRTRFCQILVAGVLFCIAHQVDAADTDQDLLASLGSSDYAQRQEATERLLRDETITTQQIVLLFAQAESYEAKHRLLDVCRHHVIRRARTNRLPDKGKGAIGVAHHALLADQVPSLNRAVVFVNQTFAGFPGYAYLRPGDLILAINDQTIPNHFTAEQVSREFVSMVQSHQAGLPVQLTIYRDGQTMPISFRLANATSLQQVYSRGATILQKPFFKRWATARQALLNTGPDPPRLSVEPHDDPPSIPPAPEQ